jgi:hypothetical protein
MLGSIMKKLKNIEIDLLLRIDFFALTKYGERDGYTDKKFEIDKESIKNKYKISKTYKRVNGGYEYIRLKDIEENIEPYEKYLRELESIDRFWCCQLEQAIGILENEELIVFFSTDTGLCYDTKSHLSAIEEMYKIESVEDWIKNSYFDVNTFFGKRKENVLQIKYSPKSNNIDTESDENEEYEIQFDEFSTKINQLKSDIRIFYKKIKEKISNLPVRTDDEDIEKVFDER